MADRFLATSVSEIRVGGTPWTAAQWTATDTAIYTSFTTQNATTTNVNSRGKNLTVSGGKRSGTAVSLFGKSATGEIQNQILDLSGYSTVTFQVTLVVQDDKPMDWMGGASATVGQTVSGTVQTWTRVLGTKDQGTSAVMFVCDSGLGTGTANYSQIVIAMNNAYIDSIGEFKIGSEGHLEMDVGGFCLVKDFQIQVLTTATLA